MTVKDVDMSRRTVTGFFNAYNFFDSDSDVILMGAAKRSIKDRGPESNATAKIKHALFHDLTLLPGKIQVLEEKTIGKITGIYFETKMSQTQIGTDTLVNYQEGIYDNHSVGFRYIDVEYVDAESKNWQKYVDLLMNPKAAIDTGYLFAVKELALWEGSTVSFGANSLTPYLGSKSLNRESCLMKLYSRLDTFEKQLHSGVQSDETMNEFELQVMQIKQMIKELFEAEPSVKDTVKPPSVKPTAKDYQYFVNNLKL
jgi:phage head maturation protease